MKKNLAGIVAKIESFPSMPFAVSKLLSHMDDPDVSASEIEKIIRYDPGLTANILKMVNSAYFGLVCEVGSVKQAIVLLGMKRLVQIVMTNCVTNIMNRHVLGYDLPTGELWRHSIAVSVAAEGLAKELKLPSCEEAFTAALLHDLGKLVLGEFVNEDIQRLEAVATEGVPFQMAEHEVLGTDHAEIGAKILENWALPMDIVNAVRWHHEPDASGQEIMLIDIVHVADVLCLMMGIGVGREGLHYEPSPSATKRLGLNVSLLEKIASQTLQWVNEFSGMTASRS
jgi:putative nucleotidyltransferase with HDIG domain